MAGSFDHCDESGEFRFNLIENMGDAWEACEEMHWLIWHLAQGDRWLIEHALKIYSEECHAGRAGPASYTSNDGERACGFDRVKPWRDPSTPTPEPPAHD